MRDRSLTISALAALLLSALVTASCSSPHARLDVALDGTPHVAPLIFHGNCQAGWMVLAALRVHETAGEHVTLTRLTFQIVDAHTNRTIGSETLDAAALQDRYGAAALQIEGDAAKTFAISARSDQVQRDPIAILGEVRGDDARGGVRTSYSLTVAQLIVEDPPSGGGACP